MRTFVTSNFSKSEDKTAINQLHKIIEDSGSEIFNFVLSYPIFEDLHELWRCAKKEVLLSDILLIDVSDSAIGRLVEVGIAYDAGKKIVVIAKNGTKKEPSMLGVADLYIEYENIEDIKEPLTNYLSTLK